MSLVVVLLTLACRYEALLIKCNCAPLHRHWSPNIMGNLLRTPEHCKKIKEPLTVPTDQKNQRYDCRSQNYK